MALGPVNGMNPNLPTAQAPLAPPLNQSSERPGVQGTGSEPNEARSPMPGPQAERPGIDPGVGPGPAPTSATDAAPMRGAGRMRLAAEGDAPPPPRDTASRQTESMNAPPADGPLGRRIDLSI